MTDTVNMTDSNGIIIIIIIYFYFAKYWQKT